MSAPRPRRGRPQRQGTFRAAWPAAPCQACAQGGEDPCPRCGHTVCAACVQRAQACPLCRRVDASCSSCYPPPRGRAMAKEEHA